MSRVHAAATLALSSFAIAKEGTALNDKEGMVGTHRKTAEEDSDAIKARDEKLAWDRLAELGPEQIKSAGLPRGFLPLPHVKHETGGQVFPQFGIHEIDRQERRSLKRFDVDFDVPDHLLRSFWMRFPCTATSRGKPIRRSSEMEARVTGFGHGVHPILITFPLGWLSTAVVFDVVHASTGTPQWAVIAFWMTVAGVVGGGAAAVPGTIDWLGIPRGTRAFAVGRLHGLGNGVVLMLFGLSLYLRKDAPSDPSMLAMVASLAGESRDGYWLARG